MNPEPKRPLVTNIHRFALDDGPGIRTTVFFKGCPLSCLWCHNPESIRPEAEITFDRHLCIHCGDCAAVCPVGAAGMEGGVPIDRTLCVACGRCAEVCPTTALRMVGRFYEAPELTLELMKDRQFYEASGGGVTFSGGEPMLYMDYIAAVAGNLKEWHIHTSIQTSGFFSFEEFVSKLYPLIDLVYFDIKLFDPDRHREFTGRDNSRILKNLLRLARLPGVKVVPRIPLIPSINDGDDNLLATAEFLHKAQYRDFVLLPYNSGGTVKRAALGQAVPKMVNDLRYDRSSEERARKIFWGVFSEHKEHKEGTI